MEIKIKKSKAETDEAHKKNLYQVGNILSNKKRTSLAVVVHNGTDFYSLVDLGSGEQRLVGARSVEELADRYYDPTDRLVTKITAEIEDK